MLLGGLFTLRAFAAGQHMRFWLPLAVLSVGLVCAFRGEVDISWRIVVAVSGWGHDVRNRRLTTGTD